MIDINYLLYLNYNNNIINNNVQQKYFIISINIILYIRVYNL